MAKERIPNGRYTKEFREEAVKLITEGGLRIPEVGRRLSLAPSTIAYWVKAHKRVKHRDTYRIIISSSWDNLLSLEEYPAQKSSQVSLLLPLCAI